MLIFRGSLLKIFYDMEEFMFKKMSMVTIIALFLVILAGCGKDPFETSIYSEQPAIVTYQDYLSQNSDLPKEGTDPILKVGTEKDIIKKGKLLFKDSDGNGKLDPYEDWRLTPEERSADLASQTEPGSETRSSQLGKSEMDKKILLLLPAVQCTTV